MKTSGFVLGFMLVGQAAFASDLQMTLTCLPESSVAPFENIVLNFNGSEIAGEVVFTEAAGYAADDDRKALVGTNPEPSDYIEGVIYVEKNEASGSGNSLHIGEIDLHIDLNDWAGVGIQILEDDFGPLAFVDFSSDGPAIAGFYRCEAR